ncbi:MAG: hypothetical protein A2X82_05510 [Geobacteraceae bacterium GWC2_55_20]|nr:MAG: hypothetical protein A2X82_05510 [Geobacteraceae bacterium GWC2_55_20]
MWTSSRSYLYRFQIKDDLKAARNEAARRTDKYVELTKTSQRREGLDMELGYKRSFLAYFLL